MRYEKHIEAVCAGVTINDGAVCGKYLTGESDYTISPVHEYELQCLKTF